MDVGSGVMVTESRNLEMTGVLKVVERQLYRRPGSDLVRFFRESYNYGSGYSAGMGVFKLKPPGWKHLSEPVQGMDGEETEVSTKVELVSSLGEASPKRRLWNRTKVQQQSEDAAELPEQPKEKMGFFRSWSTSSIQRSIEAIGLRRTERAVPNSRKGMNIVLERLRSGGLVAVLEGMRKDKEMAFAAGKGRIRGSEDD